MNSSTSLDFHYFHKVAFNSKFSEFLRVTRSHPKVVKQLFSSKRITRTEQENWFIHIYKPDPFFKIYIATNKSHSEPVGYIDFKIDSPQNRRCEIGFKVHPEYWGKGYGTEMAEWGVKQSQKFDDYEIQRLWLTVFSNNQAAVKMYRNAGFTREGTLKNYIFKNRFRRNVDIMAVYF